MARTGRAYPSHPIVFRPKVGGATPPSTPRSTAPVVVSAAKATALRPRRKRQSPIVLRGPVPASVLFVPPPRPLVVQAARQKPPRHGYPYKPIVGPSGLLASQAAAVVFVAPPHAYVVLARNPRVRARVRPPVVTNAALADIIGPRRPVVVDQPRPGRPRISFQPIVSALQYMLQPFVRPSPPTIVGPEARAKRRYLGRILSGRGKLPVAAGTLANTAPPVVTGPTLVLNTLATTDGTWTGTAPITFTYQWQRETGPGTGVYVDIPGQTANTYFTILIDVGLRIDCVVTASNPLGSLAQGSNKFGPITHPDVNAVRRLRQLPGFIVRN